MARPDFREQAAQRLATERTGHTSALLDLLKPDDPSTVTDVRRVPLDRVYSNPNQPRQYFDAAALEDLAASIREHGILQPVLVRPRSDGHLQIIAGERRWRAARMAGLSEIPVIVEQIDDEAALEIAIIENLQREDISPLEEAEIFERMTHEHGYSLRKLAQKLGKDKGYVENRLRLADAPPEIRELVSVRSDTLSHAYELMKVEDPRKRRRLAKQVAEGQLSLVKLRERINGKPRPVPAPEAPTEPETGAVAIPMVPEAPAVDEVGADVDIEAAAQHLSAAMNELSRALVTDAALGEASNRERQQFAKYLTIARIKLDNAIAVVRSTGPNEPGLGVSSPETQAAAAPGAVTEPSVAYGPHD